jgi:hypothetical protein
MKINWKVLAVAAVAAGSAVTVPVGDAAAQGKSRQKVERKDDRTIRGSMDRMEDIARRERDNRDRMNRTDGRYDVRDRDGDWRRGVTRVNRTKQGGPPFCRSGAGHPVHGRSWCVEKGYGYGSDNWGRAGGWGDVIFGRNDRDRNRTLSGGSIADVLGSVIFGRLQQQSRALGGGPMTGRWVSTSGGPLLFQVQSGSRPLAEFVDGNRDGRAEVVYLNLGR